MGEREGREEEVGGRGGRASSKIAGGKIEMAPRERRGKGKIAERSGRGERKMAERERREENT